MMAGLEHADSGSVLLGGQAPKSRQAIGQIALAFQSPTLMPWRNVRQNIQLPLEILRHDGFAAVDRVLKLTELASIDLKLPSTLSGGQAQRVSLARALVTDPKFLLLDEPFTGLDFVLRRRLSEDLSKWLQELDTTTVLVTHDPREAVLLSDHIVVLSEPPTTVLMEKAVALKRPRSFARGSQEVDSFCELVENALDRRIDLADQAAR